MSDIEKIKEIIQADDLSEFLDHQARPVNFKITKFAVDGTGVTEKPLKIVFCEDCKYADEYHHCKHVNFINRKDDFCSRGEEKEKVETVSKQDVLDTIDDFLLHTKSEESGNDLRKLRRIVKDVL